MPGLTEASKMGKVWETMKLAIQCKKMATPVAVPRILNGRTSGSITQTVGPQVMAKEMMKPARHNSVMTATVSVGLDGSESSSVESPSTTRLAVIPTNPPRSSGLRPARSIRRIATRVMRTLIAPIMRLA